MKASYFYVKRPAKKNHHASTVISCFFTMSGPVHPLY